MLGMRARLRAAQGTAEAFQGYVETHGWGRRMYAARETLPKMDGKVRIIATAASFDYFHECGHDLERLLHFHLSSLSLILLFSSISSITESG